MVMYKISELLDKKAKLYKEIPGSTKMTAFCCPICSCIYFSDDNPRCTVYRCTNENKKYSEDI